jgi:hypothetical protein
MDYKHVDKTYQHDVIAEAIIGRQHEHYHYELDRKNFEHMLTLLPEGPYKEEVKERLRTTIVEMTKVEHIHDALCEHCKADPTAHEAALTRVKARREAEKLARLNAKP